jgi:hypothetical protein
MRKNKGIVSQAGPFFKGKQQTNKSPDFLFDEVPVKGYY